MKKWKQWVASALCGCMMMNLVSYAALPDIPTWIQNEQTQEMDVGIPETDIQTATDSDAEEKEIAAEKATGSNSKVKVQSNDEVKIETVKILSAPTKSNYYLQNGKTYQLDIQIIPENATETLEFENRNPEVLEIDEHGTVTTKKTGSSGIAIYAVPESGEKRWVGSVNINVADQVYRLTFHANGGTFDNGDTETADVWDGNQFWLNWIKPSHSSKAFSKKWYTSSSCDESKLAVDESQSSYFIPTEDMDLYAGWDEAYTITYDFDGIEYDGKTQAVYQIKQGDCIRGNYIYFPDDPAKTGGKLFKGWKLKDGTVTKDIYYYTPESNETLTAVWSDYYTITFDYNGGHNKYNMTEYSKVFYIIPGKNIGNYIVDLEPDMNMYDYTLEGWLAPDGEIYMNDAWHIAQYVPSGDETLKAVWGKSHTVTFYGNGGTYGNQSTRTVQVSDGGILSTNDAVFKRDGHEFAGWKIQETGEVLSIDTEAYIVTQDLTLVAQWIQKDYWTITYEPNGGTFKNDSYKSEKVVKNQTAYVLRRAYCTKDGSVLIGWKIKDDPSGTIYSNTFVPESDVTLVAQWADAVNITLNANGGTFSTGNETTVYAAPAGQTFGHNESLETPVNGNKEFLGWYTDSDCTHPLKTSQVISSDITLYAKWTENAYTVTVHAYGPWYRDSEGNMVEKASFTIPQGSRIGSVSVPSRSG